MSPAATAASKLVFDALVIFLNKMSACCHIA
jgi:hypothetical protein